MYFLKDPVFEHLEPYLQRVDIHFMDTPRLIK